MAIHDAFNLGQAINSQSYAYKCWYNYHYGNNTMGIESNDMSKITQTWNNEIQNWQNNALDDENAYEIPDEELAYSKRDGIDQAKDKTGYNGNGSGKQKGRTFFDSAFAIGGLGISTNLIKTNINRSFIPKEVGKEWLNKNPNKGISEAKEALTNQKQNENMGSWSIAAPMALATATAYMAKKPNKEQKEACDALQDEMVNSQNALLSVQANTSEAMEEVENLTDETNSINEKANAEIKTKQSEFEIYKTSYEALVAKSQSGTKLTKEEVGLLKELAPLMKDIGADITTQQEETTDIVGQNHSRIEEYQEVLDDTAVTSENVTGVTDFAESIDESTRTMCYVESGAQTLNAASGTKASIQAGVAAARSFGFDPWAWACVAMGATGATISGVGAAEQFSWAGEVGNEIHMRRDTQDLNTETLDIYDESVQDFEGNVGIVEDLELDIPEDLEDAEALNAEIENSINATVTNETAKARTKTKQGHENNNNSNINVIGNTEINTQQTNNNLSTGKENNNQKKKKPDVT